MPCMAGFEICANPEELIMAAIRSVPVMVMILLG